MLYVLAAPARPSFCLSRPLQMRGRREDRVPAGTRGPSREIVAQEREDHRWRRRTLRPSLREWFYGLYVISSVSQCSFATVASRRPLETAQNLTPASGRQDHTISPSAFAPLVSQRIRVHRIPHSTLVTFAIAPLQSRRDEGTIALICVSGKQNYFCGGGIDGNLRTAPVGQIKCVRSPTSAAHIPRQIVFFDESQFEPSAATSVSVICL
jgi:hypothetical protein